MKLRFSPYVHYTITLILVSSIQGCVVGGKHTNLFPEVVYLKGFDSEGNGAVCSGVLVAERTVLTAKHCTCDARMSTVQFVVDGETINVHAVDPKQTDCSPDADIALVRYLPDSHTNRDPAPAKLAPKVLMQRLSGEVVVVGFGRRVASDPNSVGDKQEAVVSIVTSQCTGNDPTSCRPGELAAGRLGSSDTCNGDSGGPMFLVSDQGHFVVAITSRGINTSPSSQCGSGGIYVRIDSSAAKALLLSALPTT